MVTNRKRKPTDRCHCDWSGLLPELVAKISRNLTLVIDYASFRASCASWFSATSPFRLPPQLPWLMVPRKPPGARYSDYGGEEISVEFREFWAWIGDSDSRQFFSLTDMKSHLLYLPEARRKRLCGVGHGWLLATGCPEIFLLNPFTRAQVQLPSIIDFPAVTLFVPLPSRRGYTCSVYDRKRNRLTNLSMHNLFVGRAAVSADPATSARFAVMVSIHGHRELGYCWTGDREWTMVDAGFSAGSASLTFFDGKFYAFDFFGDWKVVSIDVWASPAKVTMLPKVEVAWGCMCYHLLVSQENLLLVGKSMKRTLEEDAVIDSEDHFHIYKLGVSGNKSKWLRVRDIGDRALFLSETNSFSVTASDYPSLCQPNCIYFANYVDPRKYLYNGSKGHVVGVYRIGKDDGLDKISTYPDGLCLLHDASWVLPSLS